jgi:hypothetical protein
VTLPWGSCNGWNRYITPSRAALRDFAPVFVGSGSKASDRRARRLRGMSAVPPIALEIVHCSDSTKSATSRPEQVQQRAWPKLRLLDDLVGAAEQRDWEGKAERFGRLEVDDQLDFHCLLDRQLSRLGTFENPGRRRHRPGDTRPQDWFHSSSGRQQRRSRASGRSPAVSAVMPARRASQVG